MSASDFPLPPATFGFLVLSLKMQVEMRLFGDAEDDNSPDLMGARHAIDLLAMLAEKTRGNLTLEEQRLIENSLTELRFRYVQAVEDAAKSKAGAAAPETAAAAKPADEAKPE